MLLNEASNILALARVSLKFEQYHLQSNFFIFSRSQNFYQIKNGLDRKQPFSSKASSLPDRILDAALPKINDHGFSLSSIIAGVKSDPELQHLSIDARAISGLFPSTTTVKGGMNEALKEKIGPRKALANRWLDEGNRVMFVSTQREGLTFEKDGMQGVKIAFKTRLEYNQSISKNHLLQALSLVVTPAEPFFGFSLPVELPHFFPYGSHALEVSSKALAGLKDYSTSREWMLRRLRLAAVYFATELISIGADHPNSIIDDELDKLLSVSEKGADSVYNISEFFNYVYRSQRAILHSVGL